MKPDLRDLARGELEARLSRLGEKPVHAAAVFAALYRDGAASFGAMTRVPARVRRLLEKEFSLRGFGEPETFVSAADGTRKLLFSFPGGAPAESVVLPGKGRLSACLSSQSGCACGCVFCATGSMGLIRDLRPSEMVAQYEACLRAAAGPLSSLVFMGMGEPFLNWENLKKAVLILSDDAGHGFPQSGMTVSTVGVVPVIRELAGSPLKLKLAVSLVAADAGLRARLVPAEARWPLREVIAAARDYCAAKKAQVFFECIIFDGVNDSAEDAERLARLIKGVPCRLNLIPHNPPGGPGAGVTPRVKAFQKAMIASGVRTYLRLEKGPDIAAACGQLAARRGGSAG
ncbi:MAG: 23S rRNA (adenine(2503)-C(2))-methyltransferase RlmN [Elusimicrobiales bacterium]|jgi:23S rRNA (adenine2503-C2)-methyltransferase|nr:23S rRNA (adenine(2503)-C(2))-methyltransferase RlmN [Elusimicrobiales bacterium]